MGLKDLIHLTACYDHLIKLLIYVLALIVFVSCLASRLIDIATFLHML